MGNIIITLVISPITLMAKRWRQVTSDVLTTFLEGFESKQVNMGVETSFGLHPLAPEEGIVMKGDIVMLVGIVMPVDIVMLVGIGAPEGIGVLEGIGVWGDIGVLEQRVAAGGSCPLKVDKKKGDHSQKEAQDRFPHRRCEGEP